MKKILTYREMVTLMLLVIINNLYAQRIMITNDSLRVHFKQEAAGTVLTNYYQKFFYSVGIDFDYKDMYYDNVIKDSLLRWLNDIEGDFISFSQLVGMGIPKESKYLRDHREKIKEAANRLIMKLEKEEKYWMDNIPFDYVPKYN